MLKHALEKEPSQKQQAQHKDKSVNNNFDKTHKILYPEPRGLSAKSHSIPALCPMSKTRPSFLPIFAALLLIFHLFDNSNGQDVDATVKITTDNQVDADIRCNFTSGDPPRDLWFLDEYAGITGLTQRLSPVYFYDKQGYLIARKRMTAVDNVNTRNIGGVGYSVNLRPHESAFAAAHVTWVNDFGGVLMLDDLFPQSLGKTAKVRIKLPLGWKVLTTELETEPDTFAISDITKSVIFVGPSDRLRHFKAAKSSPRLLMTGEWSFSDNEVMAMTTLIFKEYGKIVGEPPAGEIVISLGKFPKPVGIGNWEADVRGRTVTIMSSEGLLRSQSLQQLHEQFRHELFHLWFPNGVNLSGNYDWFYEGFALYQSLKTGVALNRIRFDDYLDTLSRAYEVNKGQTPKISFIDASRNRWVGDNNTLIYARGMLVAFLCDLALLEKSKGKRSVTNLLRQLYERHRMPNPDMDGNTAVLTLLRSYSELAPIIDRNITGSESIEWNDLLKGAGIEAELKDQTTKLKVTAKPSGRQKDLLDKLGYNNWRKLASK